jgi:hypothetical protein
MKPCIKKNFERNSATRHVSEGSPAINNGFNGNPVI